MADLLNLDQLKAKAEQIVKQLTGNKDLIAKFYEAHDMSGDPLKSIREKYIREYVEENELDVTAYQDEGWDPVELK